MTITLAPNTEALLIAKAAREGEEVNRLADDLLASILQEEARDRAEMLEGIQKGLDASDAGRIRQLATFAAEMKGKYNLPSQMSDEEILAGESLPRK